MTKPTTVPAWKCQTCGRTHPITVTECCGPSHKWNPRTPRDDRTPPNPRQHWGYGGKRCLHDSCPLCNGTGIRIDGLGPCVHGISCPCPKCSPTCLTTGVTT